VPRAVVGAGGPSPPRPGLGSYDVPVVLPLPDPPLADDVVVLRPFSLADVDRVTLACQDADIQRFTAVPSPYREADAREWISGHEGERAARTRLTMAITDAEDAVLGSVGFVSFDWPNDMGEIGYWVAPWGRGRHAAARATRLVAEWGFRELGLIRIELRISTHNQRSQRAAEHAGFHWEGVLRSALAHRSERHDLAVFSLLTGEA
jgi:RimJ/RimL family protein N-acetyltransferase